MDLTSSTTPLAKPPTVLQEEINKLRDNKIEIKSIFITNPEYSYQHYYIHCQHKVFPQLLP